MATLYKVDAGSEETEWVLPVDSGSLNQNGYIRASSPAITRTGHACPNSATEQ
jgi:hypothetical protein